jgi:hypothetical protein
MFLGVDQDADALMSEAVNAFYLSDTIGQMALAGVAVANQWNLVNGETPVERAVHEAALGA